MKNQKNFIGFDRKIRLAWLEATAEMAVQRMPVTEIRKKLDEVLEGELSGADHNSAKGKTKTVLLRIWGSAPDRLQPLRDCALMLYSNQSRDQRLLLHWGLALVNYPFFRASADSIGRLINLQETFTAAQIQRRIAEIFGERETVKTATQRVLRSMTDWGVIGEAVKKGVYNGVNQILIEDSKMKDWVSQAMMLASEYQATEPNQSRRISCLFPFKTESANSHNKPRQSRQIISSYFDS